MIRITDPTIMTGVSIATMVIIRHGITTIGITAFMILGITAGTVHGLILTVGILTTITAIIPILIHPIPSGDMLLTLKHPENRSIHELHLHHVMHLIQGAE